jgi:RND superfamily putative drug exporter
MFRPYGTRASVRQLLLWEDGDTAVMPESKHRVEAALSGAVPEA